MKVAHIFVSYREGLGYEENYLPFSQVELGADVSIVTTSLPLAMWRELEHSKTDPVPGIRKERGVEVHRLETKFRFRKGTQFFLKGIEKTLAMIGPDILHIHSPVGSLTLQTLIAAKVLDFPAVVDSHLWRFHTYDRGNRNRGPMRWTYYKLFRHVFLPYYGSVIKRYIPLGPDPEAVLHDLFGIPHSLMTHSTLGVDTKFFKRDEETGFEIRRLLNMPSNARTILFCGRIDRGKEIDVLVRAFNLLAEKHDLYLLLVGPSTPGTIGELNRCVAPGLGNRLVFTDFVPHGELPDYMSAADMAVWPGDTGISQNEAMACRLPLVHSDETAGRHLTMYGNGATFERGDALSLADAIDSILADPSRLEDMGLRSRRLAEEVFDWKVVAARTLGIYEDALRGTHTTGTVWDPAIPGRIERS